MYMKQKQEWMKESTKIYQILNFSNSRFVLITVNGRLDFSADSDYQSGFQSGPETAPLAAVIAGYCHFLSPVQARSSTCIDISKKVLYQEFFHFTYKLFIFNEI